METEKTEIEKKENKQRTDKRDRKISVGRQVNKK
jgi:hypothetical protein